ncbi:MAG: NAD(P)H-quinone oxidoreductase subunit O [Cyanobium sp.]
MADTPSDTAVVPTASAQPAALKKGALVRLNSKAYLGSLEASASDPVLPGYVVEGPGEILVVKGDYAQIRWRRPVPDVWLRLDQLESYGV